VKSYFLKDCVFGTKSIKCDIRNRSENALRFPRARDEPPHSQRTLAVGSHRLRVFPPTVLCSSLSQLRWLFGAKDRWLLENTNQFSSCDAKAVVAFLVLGLCTARPTENICGNSTCLKTPEDSPKEGRLKPFFANNLDIPFARAKQVKCATSWDCDYSSHRSDLSQHLGLRLNARPTENICTSTSCASKAEAVPVESNDPQRKSPSSYVAVYINYGD